MKKFLAILCVFLISGLILASAGESAKVNPTDIAVVSASTVGTVYFIVSGQTAILNANMEGYSFTNEASTGAPNVNGPFVNSDPSIMAYIPFCGLYTGVQGDSSRGFKEPLVNVRFVYGGHQLYLYFLTLEESDVKSIADLAGKRMSIPPVGTTGYYQAIAVLKAHGIDPDKDLTAVPMNFTDASDALKDGGVSAITINGGVMQATVTELDTTRKIRFLSIDDEKATAKLRSDYPYWDVTRFEKGVYKQQPDNYFIINGATCMIAHEQLSDDLVYTVTKILLENVDELSKIHNDGAEWNLEKSIALMGKNLVGVHPGAERYYREIGAIK